MKSHNFQIKVLGQVWKVSVWKYKLGQIQKVKYESNCFGIWNSFSMKIFSWRGLKNMFESKDLAELNESKYFPSFEKFTWPGLKSFSMKTSAWPDLKHFSTKASIWSGLKSFRKKVTKFETFQYESKVSVWK